VNTQLCPTCRSPIPENAPGGLCPACVLRDADESPTPGPTAPSIAEIAAAFPQLDGISLIGQGGMGFVYKVRQPGLDRMVALKILSPELGRDPAFAERFAREARTLGKLHHPNIVTVFEHGESGGFFYLLMEYVDGVNLRQAMRAGRFTPEQALAIVPGICDALQAAHAQGIWHRDIKPENILLDRAGHVKIADFGIARIVGDPQRDFTLTRTGNALGSAPYMAPEQHEKPHEVDHRADIYSLGVVIYEMLTGELPLGRFPAPSQRAAVDARIDEIVFQTLEKERELRQQSAREVKTDVHRAMRPEVGVPAPHARPDASRKGMGALAFAMFLVATVVTPVLWLYFARNEVVLVGLLSLLSALGLALMSWREPLGKFVTIATGALLVIAAGLRGYAEHDAVFRESRRNAALQAATPPKPVTAAPPAAAVPPAVQPPRPRAVPQPIPGPPEAPKHANLTAGEFIRLLNKLANESNGGEFGSLMQIPTTDAI
jgi:serine/threonine protein kinase